MEFFAATRTKAPKAFSCIGERRRAARGDADNGRSHPSRSPRSDGGPGKIEEGARALEPKMVHARMQRRKELEGLGKLTAFPTNRSRRIFRRGGGREFLNRVHVLCRSQLRHLSLLIFFAEFLRLKAR